MVRFQADLTVWLVAVFVGVTTTAAAPGSTMIGDAGSTCGSLAAPSDSVRIDSATLQTPSELTVSERAPTPAARIAPANPVFCKVLGQIEPTDPKAPPIKFEVNLPVEWNGRSVQYGAPGDLEGARAEGRSTRISRHSCVAAMSMASLAALQWRRFQDFLELPMRAVMPATPKDAGTAVSGPLNVPVLMQ